MRDEDEPKFAELVSEVIGFYGRDVSDFQMEVWWETCRRYEFADVRRAFSLHCQDPDRGQFPPKPADLTRILQGSGGDRSLRAWAQVERTIRTVGPYQSLVFDDPVTHAVIEEMGGWIRLCEVTDDDLPFRAAEFRKRYQGYALTGPKRFPPKLTGITEHLNAQQGMEIPSPLAIGDPERAAQVLQQGSKSGQRPTPLSQALRMAPDQSPKFFALDAKPEEVSE